MKILRGTSRSKPAFQKYLWNNFRKFLLIACIVSLVLIPAYQEAIRSTKKTSLYAIESDLNAGFVQLNQNFVRLCNQAVNIAAEDNISRITTKKEDDKFNARDYFTMLQAKKFMGNAVLMDGLLVNAYLVSRYNAVFLSDTLISENRRQVYGTFYEVENWTEEEWSEAVLGAPMQTQGFKGSFLPTVRANTVFMPQQVNVKTEVLHLVIPTASYAANFNKYFVYMINVDEIFARMKMERYIENGFMYIMDENRQIIVSKDYKEAPLEDSAMSVKFEGENCSVIRQAYPGTRLTAVIGVPDSYFISQLAPTQRLLFVFSMGVFLVALLASLLMAYLQFKPIRQAMEAVEKVNPQPETGKGVRNEYQYIAETVITLDKERRYYEEEMRLMTTTVESTMLGRILYNKTLSPEDSERFQSMFSLEKSQFICVIMRIYTGQEGSAFADSLDLTIQINHLLRKKLPEEGGVRCLYYNGDPLTTQLLFCLPVNGLDKETLVQTYHARFVDIQREIMVEANQFVTFGIGELAAGVQEIWTSRKTASTALRYADAEKPVLFVAEQEMGRSPLTAYHIRRLTTLLKEAQYDLVQDFFYEFVDSVGKNQLLSEETLRQMFYSMRGCIETVSETVSINSGGFELPEFEAEVRMRTLILSLLPPCKKLCEQFKCQNQERQEQKKNEMVTYIQENFTDNSLCALSIGEHFGVAEKYVFQVVKAYTGVTLGEYIEQLRFERAEKLLLNGMDLTEIPIMIGFNSVNTFYKAFKRVYGISPGKWRDAKQAEKGLDESSEP